jgi:hypothetical protein
MLVARGHPFESCFPQGGSLPHSLKTTHPAPLSRVGSPEANPSGRFRSPQESAPYPSSALQAPEPLSTARLARSLPAPSPVEKGWSGVNRSPEALSHARLCLPPSGQFTHRQRQSATTIGLDQSTPYALGPSPTECASPFCRRTPRRPLIKGLATAAEAIGEVPWPNHLRCMSLRSGTTLIHALFLGAP